MRTIELAKEKIYCGALLLVNAQHPLQNNQIDGLLPADLRFPHIYLRRDAANALRLILETISAGSEIVPVSGYRSVEEQIAIYKNALWEHGEAFTRKYVALPDCSEHQTGLAIDLGLNQKEIDFICPKFPYEGICQEFRRIASDYGYIERYQKEKEKITGISQEPWHFRYVGYPHSKIMEEEGLSLEEYTAFLKDYREDCQFVYPQAQGQALQIYYVPAKAEITRVKLPEHSVYQISGNNVDGFIVTIWRKRNG